MRRLAVTNLKGGVGKTTTLSLGASVTLTGLRVLLIDCSVLHRGHECDRGEAPTIARS